MSDKLLTIDDVRKRYQCGRDAAYRTIQEAGGKKIAGKWRIRAERLDQYELNEPRRRFQPRESVPDLAAELMAG